MTESPKAGKKRNFFLVLLFIIITFGIYGLYWFFANLKEMQRGFSFQEDAKFPRFAKLFYILAIFINFAPLGIIFYGLFQVFSGNQQWLAQHKMLLMLANIAAIVVNVLAFYFFTKTVELAQEKASLEAFNFTKLFSIYVVSILLVLIASLSPYLGILGGLLALVYFFMLQKEINRLWE